VSSDEAVQLVAGAASPARGAEQLVDLCTARWQASRFGAYRDDITALVIRL